MSNNLTQDQGSFGSGEWPGITIQFLLTNKLGPCKTYHKDFFSLGDQAVQAINPVYSGLSTNLMLLLTIKSLWSRCLCVNSLGSNTQRLIQTSFGNESLLRMHQGFGFIKNQNIQLQLGVYVFLM